MDMSDVVSYFHKLSQIVSQMHMLVDKFKLVNPNSPWLIYNLPFSFHSIVLKTKLPQHFASPYCFCDIINEIPK